MKGKKTGGRTAGTPNKATTAIREHIQAFVERNSGDLQAIYSDLAPRDRFRFIIDLLPYITPKIQAVQMRIEQPSDPLTIIIHEKDIPQFPDNSE